MVIRSLAFALVAGVLWADCGGTPPTRVVAALTGAFVLFGVSTVRSISAHSMGWARLERAALCISLLFSFEAGFTGLDARLGHATRDRGHAETLAAVPRGSSPRIVVATVESRRERNRGADFELSNVRAVDGGHPVPERLILRTASYGQPGGVGGRRESPAPRARADQALWPGTRARLALRIRPILARRNPGAVDFEHASARRGLGAEARLVDPNWVAIETDRRWPVASVVSRVVQRRSAVRQEVARWLSAVGDRRGLARALSLGDRSTIDAELVEDFRSLGLSHLLAVSGLHVGLCAAVLGTLALRILTIFCPECRHPFRTVFVLVGLGCLAYAAWVGAGVSVVRACLVFGLAGLLTLMRRGPNPAELLSGIVCVLVLHDPAVVFDLGAQLSFGACFGLVAAGVWQGTLGGRGSGRDPWQVERRGDPSLCERISRGFVLSLRVSCAAGFGTAPVLMAHSMQMPGISPIANALAVPAATLVVLPASLVTATALLLEGMFFGWDGDPSGVSAALGRGAMLAVELFVTSIAWAASIQPVGPLFELWHGESALSRLAIFVGAQRLPIACALAGLGLVALRARVARLSWPCWCALAVCAGVPPVDASLAHLDVTQRVWFFDVGQGDATLFESTGRTLLVDAGPGAPDGSGGRALARSLVALGHRSIDVLVVTHADLDHRGGAYRLVEEFAVAHLWLPVSGREDPGFERLVALAKDRRTSVYWRSNRDAAVRLGGLRIETLWPPADSIARSRNAGSLVLRVKVRGQSFLLMADVDGTIESRLVREHPDRVRADFLKASHHGSRGGTRTAFLRHVGARHAIVSAPCVRGRGLPHPKTLERIERSSTRLWWSGRDGAIAVLPAEWPDATRILAWGGRRVCP